MEGEQLEQAAEQAGILDSFINMREEVQSVSALTKQALLAAMGRGEEVPSSAAPLPAVLVFVQANPVVISPKGKRVFDWQLTLENGDILSGKLATGKALHLPKDLPTGYHQLSLTDGETPSGCRIIIVPRRCYEPDALLAGEKLWGATVQLYTLRSEHNWGVGDFGDLKRMVEEVGKRGR